MDRKNRAWIELNPDHLRHNLRQLQGLVPSSCALMPAVKADAYGHGAVAVSQTLQAAGVRHFCVASAEEGIQLRKAGITGEILILGCTAPEMLGEVREYRLTQTVVDAAYGQLLQRWAYGTACSTATAPAFSPAAACNLSHTAPLPVHVAVDTGMHRLGEPWENQEALAGLWKLPALRITGLFSHLCVSDSLREEDIAFTRLQVRRFRDTVSALRRRGLSGFACHLQASYGILNAPAFFPAPGIPSQSPLSLDLARPGIALYGCLSSPGDHPLQPASLRPVLSLKARVAAVKHLQPGESAGYGLDYTADREATLAVLAIGYGDGIPRSLSAGRGSVLIRGQEAPIAGRICMDQLLADVTHIPGVSPGQEAVLIGTCGGKTLSAEAQAQRAGTITNELLSRLGGRLPRLLCE